MKVLRLTSQGFEIEGKINQHILALKQERAQLVFIDSDMEPIIFRCSKSSGSAFTFSNLGPKIWVRNDFTTGVYIRNDYTRK